MLGIRLGGKILSSELKAIIEDRTPELLTDRSKKAKQKTVRWFILFLIALVTCINYIDRAIISLAAPNIQADLQIDPALMGIIFSVFGWSYTFSMLFSGYFLDRFGPRKVYTVSLIFWSVFTFMVGTAKSISSLITYRIGLGAFESPSIPTNALCVSEWFPKKERATAVGIYTGTQYIGLAFLTPVFTWIIITFGWNYLFYIAGIIGILIGLVWYGFYRNPREHKRISQQELNYIKEGGGMIGTEEKHPFYGNGLANCLNTVKFGECSSGNFPFKLLCFSL